MNIKYNRMMNTKLTNNYLNFQKTYGFEQRCIEGMRILSKYPHRIPIICEKDKKTQLTGNLVKEKFLVDKKLTCGQFIYMIRKNLELPAEKAIFLIVNGILPSNNISLSELYSLHKSNDGFLYITYSSENVFG